MEPTRSPTAARRPRARFALALTSAALLLTTLPACSGSNNVTVVEEPVGAASGERFQDLWFEMTALFRKADDMLDESEPPPQSAAEANDRLGLSDTSDLWFADYSADENGDAERMCLVSPDGTYVTFDWTRELDIFLGDGECSYDEAAAAVVGTVLPGEWVKGSALMGDLRVDAIVSNPSLEDRLDEHAADESPSPATESPGLASAPAGEALADDARRLGSALAAHLTAEGSYPSVAAGAVARTLGVRLSKGTLVRAYRVEPDSFQICVTNKATGAFASYDAKLGDVASGAGNPVDLLDALCGIAPAPASP